MNKDPAFLFYSKDWLEGTAEMLPEEKGVYIDLLAYQHQRGSLPNDKRRLARLVRMSADEFERIWETISSKFVANGDRLINQRLSDVMTERSQKGRKNKLIGTFAYVLRKMELTKKQHQFLKQQFNVDDFLNDDTEWNTERLTKWCTDRLSKRYTERSPNGTPFIEDATANENKNNTKGGTGGNRFKKPTVDEIRQYCEQRKNGIDAQQFYDHYESNGWHVGKNKMKDWKAAVRTWERRRKQNGNDQMKLGQILNDGTKSDW